MNGFLNVRHSETKKNECNQRLEAKGRDWPVVHLVSFVLKCMKDNPSYKIAKWGHPLMRVN